ncbi:MAG TPA: protein kinase [Bryobacteraceae bacterium]|nr:protein kinase [Bryobacteraceae bacterium]
MTPERWRQVKSLFDKALEKAPAERTVFLDGSCGEDHDLRRDVESLIGAYAEAGNRYEAPAMGADPMIGRQIGPYRILRQLSAGGMGAIYLASRADDQFRRLVAVKAIRPELLDDHTRRRFENERHTLAALEHPNIVKLLDGGTTEDGVPYLVMDYVEGQPLDRFCADRGLTIAERLGLFRTLCAAVHYAHQNLVVHRDLKPANVLVTPQGVPKLLDFGIAKLLRPAYAAATVGYTQSIAQPMTPKYASPEQILGQPITTASDIYSLGLLLYVILTGVHPFERETQSAIELERAISEGKAKRPSEAALREAARELRGDLDTIVLAAMRKEPQRRYASAEHLAEDVRRYLEGQPVLARGDTVVYRARKFVGRHRAAVAASAVAAVLMAFLAVRDDIDRRRAERRFEDLHDFANFVILDLDKAMQHGTTDARKLVVAKALPYLAEEARGDARLQHDAVAGYLAIAGIQGDPFLANLGEADAGRNSVMKALAVAEALGRRDPRDPKTRSDLLECHERLADILEQGADHAGAIEHYRKALDFADADPVGALIIWSKLPNVQDDAGDPAAALESSRQCERAALEWLNRHPDDQAAGRLLAFARERIAWFAVLAGESTAGAEEPKFREAIDVYEKSLRARQSPTRRHNVANAHLALAEILKRENKIAEALENCRTSLSIWKSLLAADPHNEQYLGTSAYATVLLIELMQADGKPSDARLEAAHAVAELEPEAHAKTPLAPLLSAYLSIVLNPQLAEFYKGEDTISLARRAVEMSHGSEPQCLHLLAQAYDRGGNPAEALATVKKAIAMLPAVPAGRPEPEIRKELEATSTALEAELGEPQRKGK